MLQTCTLRMIHAILVCALVASAPALAHAADPQPLAGTQPLTAEGDIASQMVSGIDSFLLRETNRAIGKRNRFWKMDFSSPEAYARSVEPNRKRLAELLGMNDTRIPFDAPEFVTKKLDDAMVGSNSEFKIYAIRWPVLDDPDPNRSDAVVHGEGLMVVPRDTEGIIANVIAIPDAEYAPEEIIDLSEKRTKAQPFAKLFASEKCRVFIPCVITRDLKERNGRSLLTNREFLHRAGFETGRHLIGYEVQKILALVDWLDAERKYPKFSKLPIGIAGYGEGGLLALYAAALDTRCDAVFVSGGFGNIDDTWKQPVDRNVFSLVREFGDLELAAMIMPRPLYLECNCYPQYEVAGAGGAPGKLERPGTLSLLLTLKNVISSGKQMGKATIRFAAEDCPEIFVRKLRSDFISRLQGVETKFDIHGKEETPEVEPDALSYGKFAALVREVKGNLPGEAARQARQVAEIDRHIQLVLRESPYVRDQYMKKLYDAANSKDLAAYEKVADEYRKMFYDDVIGRFDNPMLPANPRTRKAYDTDKFTGYEVMLDVFPDVFAYGLLLLPKDLKPGEKRPIVVCQHGLEGRPKDVVEGNKDAYHDFAAKLCERGFITFAPQNPYIFEDRFRTLQRKANALGKTLFSIIVPQHQQITDWLKTLPMVDGERIGFYGLSYGGKSAMRIPPLVKNYCLSICSADFNDWVDKNASTRNPHSYVWSNEYEIFEWDLASRFNYAEMAALIAPRPFMVERGHFDGVASDETVASEFAKVKFHYAARLGIGDRCEMETFVGPHTINGQGTFRFLHKHLKWPEPK